MRPIFGAIVFFGGMIGFGKMPVDAPSAPLGENFPALMLPMIPIVALVLLLSMMLQAAGQAHPSALARLIARPLQSQPPTMPRARQAPAAREAPR